MKRSIGFGIVVLIIATMAFGPASAQDNSQATISALQTQVADLQSTVDARGEKINAQRTQVADLKGRVSDLESQVPTPTPQPAAPQLGSTVKADNWEIVVQSTELRPTTGQSTNTFTAKGVYLAVVITLTNTGTETADFPYRYFQVIDSKSRKFESDFEATYVLNAYDYDFLSNDGVQPGIPYTVGFAFDVPVDASGFIFTTKAGDFRVVLDR